jgi:6-phosphofructokinase
MATSEQRRVLILFSGGDAPGMNALLRAFVRLGHKRHGADVLGAGGRAASGLPMGGRLS